MNKTELRKHLAILRSRLTVDYKTAAGAAITEKVLASKAFKAAIKVFVYVNTEDEPDTLKIIDTALLQGKKVYVPRCLKKPFMEAVRIESRESLKEGKYGILEPVGQGESVTARELDLIIVPCVSASEDGRRIGHGAGYYDTFLETAAATKMCLCFKQMMTADIPMDTNDILMDIVIFE